MKKLFAATALAGAFILGGCNATTTGQNVQDVINQVQAGAQQACGFLPVATTVTGILATLTGQPAINTVATAAEMICNAVRQSASSGMRMGARRAGVNYTMGSVNGVAVVGQFTR